MVHSASNRCAGEQGSTPSIMTINSTRTRNKVTVGIPIEEGTDQSTSLVTASADIAGSPHISGRNDPATMGYDVYPHMGQGERGGNAAPVVVRGMFVVLLPAGKLRGVV